MCVCVLKAHCSVLVRTLVLVHFLSSSSRFPWMHMNIYTVGVHENLRPSVCLTYFRYPSLWAHLIGALSLFLSCPLPVLKAHCSVLVRTLVLVYIGDYLLFTQEFYIRMNIPKLSGKLDLIFKIKSLIHCLGKPQHY